jgi:hypothetical protein
VAGFVSTFASGVVAAFASTVAAAFASTFAAAFTSTFASAGLASTGFTSAGFATLASTFASTFASAGFAFASGALTTGIGGGVLRWRGGAAAGFGSSSAAASSGGTSTAFMTCDARTAALTSSTPTPIESARSVDTSERPGVPSAMSSAAACLTDDGFAEVTPGDSSMFDTGIAFGGGAAAVAPALPSSRSGAGVCMRF